MILAPEDIKVALAVIFFTIEQRDTMDAKSIENASTIGLAARLEEQHSKNRAAMNLTAHIIEQTWSKQ